MLQHFQRFLQTQSQEAAHLVVPVSAEEILAAIHSYLMISSGSNGYTKEFYVASCTITGKNFIVVVWSFYLFGFLPTGIKTNIIDQICLSKIKFKKTWNINLKT